MAINKRPLLKQRSIENLEQDLAERQKIVTVSTVYTLNANFSVNKIQEADISSNTVLTISGLNIGETAMIIIKNTHITEKANVTIPDSISHPGPAVVPALTWIKITITRLSTAYMVTWGGAMT